MTNWNKTNRNKSYKAAYKKKIALHSQRHSKGLTKALTWLYLESLPDPFILQTNKTCQAIGKIYQYTFFYRPGVLQTRHGLFWKYLQNSVYPKPLELGCWNFETMFTTPCVSCFTCHVSHVTCHVSCVTCHVSHVTCPMSEKREKKRRKKRRKRTCDTLHVTCDTWHVTHDTQGVVNIVSKCQLPTSYNFGYTVT